MWDRPRSLGKERNEVYTGVQILSEWWDTWRRSCKSTNETLTSRVSFQRDEKWTNLEDFELESESEFDCNRHIAKSRAQWARVYVCIRITGQESREDGGFTTADKLKHDRGDAKVGSEMVDRRDRVLKIA